MEEGGNAMPNNQFEVLSVKSLINIHHLFVCM